VTAVWNIGVKTYGEVTAKRLGIIIKKEKKCIFIEMAIPADRKLTQKEAENKNKHEFVYRARKNVVQKM
jgi:hypothetical protein